MCLPFQDAKSCCAQQCPFGMRSKCGSTTCCKRVSIRWDDTFVPKRNSHWMLTNSHCRNTKNLPRYLHYFLGDFFRQKKHSPSFHQKAIACVCLPRTKCQWIKTKRIRDHSFPPDFHQSVNQKFGQEIVLKPANFQCLHVEFPEFFLQILRQKLLCQLTAWALAWTVSAKRWREDVLNKALAPKKEQVLLAIYYSCTCINICVNCDLDSGLCTRAHRAFHT